MMHVPKGVESRVICPYMVIMMDSMMHVPDELVDSAFVPENVGTLHPTDVLPRPFEKSALKEQGTEAFNGLQE